MVDIGLDIWAKERQAAFKSQLQVCLCEADVIMLCCSRQLDKEWLEGVSELITSKVPVVMCFVGNDHQSTSKTQHLVGIDSLLEHNTPAVSFNMSVGPDEGLDEFYRDVCRIIILRQKTSNKSRKCVII